MIIKRIDYDNNGEINYSEFLSGTMREENLNEENLKKLFKALDIFSMDYLTKESLIKTFQRSNKEIEE